MINAAGGLGIMNEMRCGLDGYRPVGLNGLERNEGKDRMVG
jgi:hypothetical protein